MIVNKDGRVVVYSGDDAQFDYVYRFVSAGTLRGRATGRTTCACCRKARCRLPASTTTARVTWLPLVFGEGPLTPANGFQSQADVVIDVRLAADLLKATRMDRPEDVQPHPTSGKVFVILTNNERRRPEQVDKANPRPQNEFGHIIEMTGAGRRPHGGDLQMGHADRVRRPARGRGRRPCGTPRPAPTAGSRRPTTAPSTPRAGCGSPPTRARPGRRRRNKLDGLYALETEGREARLVASCSSRCPVGAELCGPCFTPDDETVFLAVQHPATDGVRDWKPFGREFDLRGPGDPLAGLQARHAAAPRRRRDPQEGRRQDRRCVSDDVNRQLREQARELATTKCRVTNRTLRGKTVALPSGLAKVSALSMGRSITPPPGSTKTRETAPARRAPARRRARSPGTAPGSARWRCALRGARR